MSNPRFSIVIPTRNRHSTLKYALLTCLNQKNFDDYEIIVCDNCSSPETKETVESFESEKIKYIRSDLPLAMSQNWELAVFHAEGEYVIIIGDDDGFLPNALYMIDQILNILGVKALRWDSIIYKWPDLKDAWKGIEPNRLDIPLARENIIMDFSKVIPKITNFKMEYTVLPLLYRSAIHRDLVSLLKDKTGSIFAASSPDVYSGFAIGYLVQNYASVGVPMTIDGHSASSGGLSVLFSKDNPISQEFNRLNIEADLRCQSKIPDIPVIPAIVADSFISAKDRLFPGEKYALNRKRLVIKSAEALKKRYLSGIDDEDKFNIYLARIRDSLVDDASLQKWFDRRSKDLMKDDISIPRWLNILKKCDNKFFGNSINRSCRIDFEKGFNGKDLVLDASEFNLKNVFDIAQFCDNLYSTNVDKLEWHGKGIKSEILINISNVRKLVGKILYNI